MFAIGCAEHPCDEFVQLILSSGLMPHNCPIPCGMLISRGNTYAVKQYYHNDCIDIFADDLYYPNKHYTERH